MRCSDWDQPRQGFAYHKIVNMLFVEAKKEISSSMILKLANAKILSETNIDLKLSHVNGTHLEMAITD